MADGDVEVGELGAEKKLEITAQKKLETAYCTGATNSNTSATRFQTARGETEMEAPFALSGNAEAFEEVDPYNPGNTVRGYINRGGDRKYGALWITHVNGEECHQLIYGTPKMHYPFHETRGFFKPPKDSQIEVYEKYDGTNILAFVYADSKGERFMSFKTRLRPFLGSSKFGDFKNLWDEVLDANRMRGDIFVVMCVEGINLSFELFGKRNKILIDYPVSLDYRLLFGVANDGTIVPLTDICTDYFKKAELVESFPGGDNLDKEYARVREDLNKKLIVVKTLVDGEEKVESMSGSEGYILYVVGDYGATQLKAKPDAVQDIHWAESKGIPYHSIYTTVVNAFEETDEPTEDMIKRMLLEEYTEDQVERRRCTIRNMLRDVRFEKVLKAELRVEYLKNGFNIIGDKKTCMRHFGNLYDKRIAGKIYKYLMDEFGGTL